MGKYLTSIDFPKLYNGTIALAIAGLDNQQFAIIQHRHLLQRDIINLATGC